MYKRKEKGLYNPKKQMKRLVEKITTGTKNLKNGNFAIILNGKLRVYEVTEIEIAYKMQELDSVEKVKKWLEKKRIGQLIDFLEEGSYYTDNMEIKLKEGVARIYEID